MTAVDGMSNIERCPATRLTMDDLRAFEQAEDQRERDGWSIQQLTTEVERLRQQFAGAVSALERIERGHNGDGLNEAHYFSVRDCRRIAREALAALRGQ